MNGMQSTPTTILMIEDEVRISKWVSKYFEKEGLQVTLAEDGPLGLHLARTQPFDLIILDLMLPGMDGIDLCQRLREESEIPILMLTARNEEADRVRGLNLGADDYMGKPFGLSELLARTLALLRRSRGNVRQPRIIMLNLEWEDAGEEAEGWPVGRVQRLSYGHNGRERRQPVADHPRCPGCLRRCVAEQG